jgi:hypothetical protein
MKFTRTHLLCALLLATSPLARAGQIEVAVILAAPPQVSAHTAAVAHLDNATPAPKPESTLYAPMPEPDSVAIMAAGLGLAGFVMRRRRHGKQRAG